MKIEVTLNPEDCARLGCPEKMLFDFDDLSIDDLIDVQKVTGLNGHHFSRKVFEGDALASKALVWMALRQQNIKMSYDALTYKLKGSLIDFADEEVDEEGKAQSPSDTPSEKATT